MNTLSQPNTELFSMFKKELLLFSKDRDNYDLERFIREIFYLNIQELSLELPHYFFSLVKSQEVNLIDIYDFCCVFINNDILTFLNTYNQSVLKLPSFQEQEEEFIAFESYCTASLLLFNAIFLFNQTLEKNMINMIADINDILIKESVSKVCKTKEKEIISDLTSVLVYLKKLKKKTPSEYNDLLCDNLNIDEDFKLSLIDN